MIAANDLLRGSRWITRIGPHKGWIVEVLNVSKQTVCFKRLSPVRRNDPVKRMKVDNFAITFDRL